MNRMTGAEFAIIRQQLGLTLDEKALERMTLQTSVVEA